MEAKKRIYAVTIGATTRLVEAANKSQAINHVAKDTVLAAVATQGDLIALTKSGVEVETTGQAEIEAE
jgi:hypothetical protein